MKQEKSKKKSKFNGIVKRILKDFFIAIIKIFVIIPRRIKVEGKENLVKGPAVLVANHKSAYDPMFMLGSIDKNISFIAKKEVWNIPLGIGKFIAYIFDMIPVSRNGKDLRAIKDSLKVLEKEKYLGIFPEGKRYGLSKGKKMKSGAIHIAISKNIPVIPIGISGNCKLFNKTTLNIGKPIYFKFETDDHKRELDEYTKVMQNQILNLVNKEEYKEFRAD